MADRVAHSGARPRGFDVPGPGPRAGPGTGPRAGTGARHTGHRSRAAHGTGNWRRTKASNARSGSSLRSWIVVRASSPTR